MKLNNDKLIRDIKFEISINYTNHLLVQLLFWNKVKVNLTRDKQQPRVLTILNFLLMVNNNMNNFQTIVLPELLDNYDEYNNIIYQIYLMNTFKNLIDIIEHLVKHQNQHFVSLLLCFQIHIVAKDHN